MRELPVARERRLGGVRVGVEVEQTSQAGHCSSEVGDGGQRQLGLHVIVMEGELGRGDAARKRERPSVDVAIEVDVLHPWDRAGSELAKRSGAVVGWAEGESESQATIVGAAVRVRPQLGRRCVEDCADRLVELTDAAKP